MEGRIKDIIAGFRLEIENTSWPTASVRISTLAEIVRWAAETELRELQAKAEGQLQVLRFLAARMPDRDTKRTTSIPAAGSTSPKFCVHFLGLSFQGCDARAAASDGRP